MDGTTLQAIAIKQGGQFAPDSLVFTHLTGTIVDYSLSIPSNYVAYLLKTGGYTQVDGIKVEFIDQDGAERWEWTEYMDVFSEHEIMPFLEKRYKDTIIFRFTNTSGSSSSIGWFTDVLLIPAQNFNEFEADVKALGDFIPVLKEIRDLLRLNLEVKET